MTAPTRMSAARLEEIREWAEACLHHGERENLFELLAELREVTRERDEARAFMQHTAAYASLELLKEYDVEGESNTLEALVIKALKERDKLKQELADLDAIAGNEYAIVCHYKDERDRLQQQLAETERREVQLEDILGELVDILDDPEARKQIDSFTTQPARAALDAEKGKGV